MKARLYGERKWFTPTQKTLGGVRADLRNIFSEAAGGYFIQDDEGKIHAYTWTGKQYKRVSY